MTNKAHPLPHDFFVDTWKVYQKIVQGGFMFHQALYRTVEHLLQAREPVSFSLLDLGCGDASNLYPMLRNRPIALYKGVDLSSVALECAAEHLKELPTQIDLVKDDMLDFLQRGDGESFDVIFSGFALHHLSSADKQSFITAVKKRLTPGGSFILVDVFREEDQDLSSYLDAYCGKMASDWTTLSKEECAYAVSHVREFDRPDTVKSIEIIARETGFKQFKALDRHTWHQVIQIS